MRMCLAGEACCTRMLQSQQLSAKQTSVQTQFSDTHSAHTCSRSRRLVTIMASVATKKMSAPAVSSADIATIAARLLKGRVAGGSDASDRNASVICVCV